MIHFAVVVAVAVEGHFGSGHGKVIVLVLKTKQLSGWQLSVHLGVTVVVAVKHLEGLAAATVAALAHRRVVVATNCVKSSISRPVRRLGTKEQALLTDSPKKMRDSFT